MTNGLMRALTLTTALALVAGCDTSTMDWDLRPGTLNTSDAARQATADRPQADARGVISYPTYQVAVAQRGDTVALLAQRVGLPVDEVARYNALIPTDPLRPGEVVALPRRVAEPSAATGAAPAPTPAAVIGSAAPGTVSTGPIATTPLEPAPAPAAPPPAAAEPVRHQVQRGETAYSVARLYNVSASALAEWNGLGSDLALREGQYLIIPVALPNQPARTNDVSPPGAGSPTPEPPSAAKPLPAEKPAAANAPAPGTPASPDLGAQRSGASSARMAYPVQGSIIRGYVAKKNDGIDIAAAAGTPVKAAADGTVAAITVDTDQVPILVLRHADNLLTVYANIDGISVAKGAAVKRGQTIAKVRAANPAFLHFEVRKGFDSTDPMPYLQ